MGIVEKSTNPELWLSQLLKDPNRRPYSKPTNIAQRIVNLEEDAALAERILREFIAQGKYRVSSMYRVPQSS
jgi:hypothetical protein